MWRGKSRSEILYDIYTEVFLECVEGRSVTKLLLV